MPIDLKKTIKEFRVALGEQSIGTQKTDLGIYSLYQLALQLIEYMDENPQSSDIPKDIITHLEGFEKFLVSDPSTIKYLTKLGPDLLEESDIGQIVSRLYSKSQIQKKVLNLKQSHGSPDEVIYSWEDDKNIEHSLSQEELVALQYIEHLYNYPSEKFDDEVQNHFMNNPIFKKLMSRDILVGLLEALAKDYKRHIPGTIQNQIMNIRSVLYDVSFLQETLQTYKSSKANPEKFDYQFDKYFDGMALVEHLETNPHASFLLGEQTIKDLEQEKVIMFDNFELRNELRYMEIAVLEECDISVFTETFLDGDQEYVDNLRQELKNAISNPEDLDQPDEYGFTKKELLILRLLSVMDPKLPTERQLMPDLDEDEIKFINDFIKKSTGDMALNEKLEKIEKNKSLVKTIDGSERFSTTAAVGNLKNFCYRTRRKDKYFEKGIGSRFIANSKRTTPSEVEKISLRDYGILADMGKVPAILPESIYSKDPGLKQIYDAKKEIAPVLKTMRDAFQSHIQGGSLFAMRDLKRKKALRGVKMTFWEKVKYFVNNRSHASMLFRKKDTVNFTQSHVANTKAGVMQNEFSFDEFMYSDLYRIKLDALVADKRARSRLVNLGAHIQMDWKQYINTKYTMIQRRVHDDSNKRLGKIKLAKYEKRGAQSIFRRFKFRKTDFKEIKDKMIGCFYQKKSDSDPNVEMICSEFVADCTIAALVELNEQLKLETGCDTDIIKIPISKNEDIRFLTPERFVKLLKEQKCLEEVKIPEHLHGISRDPP